MSKRYRNRGRGFTLPPAIMANIIMQNKTVALVGTHPITREKAPFHDPSVDIWIFNGQSTMDWCPRASAVFDIHPPDDIFRRAQEDLKFGEWLHSEKDVPFYTPHITPNCPGNIVYPLEDVISTLLPNFKRGEQINRYFTSGPCYAIALAIFHGYTRIEMYGIEMENNTEYIYQRDGIGLWLGIAVGRGIEVVLPEQSMIFYAPLYGFEMDASKVDREAFEARASELQQLMDKTHSEYNRARGIVDAVQKEFIDAQTANIPQDDLMKIAQKYEDAQNMYEQAIANHAFVNGQYIDCRSWQSRVEKVMEYNGQAQMVLAQNDEKWTRVEDKLALTGRTLPNE
jgi:hypothetical protein